MPRWGAIIDPSDGARDAVHAHSDDSRNAIRERRRRRPRYAGRPTRMTRIICLTFAVTLVPGPQSWAQRSSGDVPIRVVLPRTAKTSSCLLKYFLVGPFGGYGGFVPPKLDASEFEIETVHEGAAVERLQVILWCSGYQIETMDFDSLPDVGDRTVDVHPKPLGTVRFRGVVRGLPLRPVQVLYVDVDYTPWWTCEFFHLLDCLLGSWTVASVELDAESRFSVALPNFARDAVIGMFKDPGEFAFRIRDQKTGNPLFELRATGRNSAIPGNITVAESYRGEQVFDAELPK